MKISACYIVKNEQENIRHSIESLKNQYDELIVIDTGSEDGTVDVVRSLGGNVFAYQWQDDFAAARNFALAKATGDWLIFLDADEYFTAATAGNLRRVLEMASPEADGILVDMVNFDADTGEVQDHFYQARLLRNWKGLHYEGIIHEAPQLSNGDMLSFQRVSSDLLQIYHTGYRRSLSREKAERNLPLLQKMVAMGKPEAELARYFCDCYKGLGDTKNFLRYGWLEVRQGKRCGNYDSRCYKVLLNYYAERKDWESRESRLRLCQLAVEQFPDLPDFWAEYSESLFQWRRYEEAVEAASRAICLLDDYDGMEPCQLLREKEAVEKLLYERRSLFRKRAENVQEYSISACVIVKNEAANIGKWLANVKAFASELIVVDTGSSDATLDILKQHNIRYYRYDWQDDFAAAKNFALEKAQGDWVVFTDADELFTYPASIPGALADLVLAHSELETVEVPLYNIDADNNGALLNINRVVRLFKNNAGLGYYGRIHEQIVDLASRERELVCMHGGRMMSVEHTGYSAHIISGKLARNLKMMLREVEQGANPELYFGHMAECYFGLGEYEKALNYALRAIQAGYQAKGQQGDVYWLALEAMEILGYEHEDKLAIVENALPVTGEIPDFYGYKGYFLWQQHEWQQARSYLEKAMTLYEESLGCVSASHFAQLMAQFQSALADCCHQLGDTALARRYYKAVLAANKWYDKALLGYLDTFGDWHEPEANDFLKAVYHEAAEWDQLMKLLYVNGFELTAEDGGKLAYMENQVPEQLMEALAMNIQYLFVGILSRRQDFSSAMLREQLELLPLPLRSVVYTFFGKNELAGEFAFSDYCSMLSAVLRWGNDDVAEVYINMAERFGENNMVQVARQLIDYEKYELALGLLGRIAADSPAADAQFWFTCGKLFFWQGDYERAISCLLRVDDDEVKDSEFASYAQWCKEKLGV